MSGQNPMVSQMKGHGSLSVLRQIKQCISSRITYNISKDKAIKHGECTGEKPRLSF